MVMVVIPGIAQMGQDTLVEEFAFIHLCGASKSDGIFSIYSSCGYPSVAAAVLLAKAFYR